MTIRQAGAPNMHAQPDIKLFRKDDFEAAIWSKGYDAQLEQAIECPCIGSSGSPRVSCKNCLGLGLVFINPLQTRLLVTSINRSTQHKDWSPEMMGTISVTARDQERFSHMDRITFLTRTGIMSEVRDVRHNDAENQDFFFCSYKIHSIKHVFVFDGDSSKLKLIPPSDYSINEDNSMVVNINNHDAGNEYNGAVSIEYEHLVSYNIVDLPHDFRSTFVTNDKGQNIEHNMPVQAIARRSHIELNSPTNWGGNNLINNDTL